MKWKPFGKDSETEIEAFRRGCASKPCIHIKINMAMHPDEASRLTKIILKAIKYAGRKRAT